MKYKFRGKDCETQEWCYGGIDSTGGCISVSSIGKERYIAIVPESVGQYTGLKDTNDKEIYDGDLVLVVDYPNWTDAYLVKFCEENLCWALYDSYGYSESLNEFDKFRIIGNIYDEAWKLK